MERQDHIKRQIDQLGRLLGKIFADLLGLKTQGNTASEFEFLCQSFKHETDIDLEEWLKTSDEAFIKFLENHKGFNNENLSSLAELLLLAADGRYENKRALYEKSLAIYQYLEQTDLTYSLERQWKIEQIKNVIAGQIAHENPENHH